MYVYSKQIAHEKASAQSHAPFSREWVQVEAQKKK